MIDEETKSQGLCFSKAERWKQEQAWNTPGDVVTPSVYITKGDKPCLSKMVAHTLRVLLSQTVRHKRRNRQ